MRRPLSVLALSTALGAQLGCAGNGLHVTPVGGYAPSTVKSSIRGDLYVSNRPAPLGYGSSKLKCPTWISVYRAGTADLVNKLPGLCKGRDGGASLAFDQEGNAYWADYFNGAVLVFAPRKTKPSYTIALGASDAYTLAVDGSGRLYVANLGPGPVGYAKSSISVYAHGQAKPSYTITKGITYPTSLSVSASGEVFVANCPLCISQYYGYSNTSNVTVYAPGKKSPSRIIYGGVDEPNALALDSAGNLYVANECASSSCTRGSVTVYPPKATKPSLTITQGFGTPSALTVGGDGTLYVSGGNNVVEFAQGSTEPEAAIPVPECKATALTLDDAANLYVLLANCRYSSPEPQGEVAVYSPGATKPAYIIRKGIDGTKNSFAIAP